MKTFSHRLRVVRQQELYLVSWWPRKTQKDRRRHVRRGRQPEDQTVAAGGVVDEPGRQRAPGRDRAGQHEEETHQGARLVRSEEIADDRRKQGGDRAVGEAEGGGGEDEAVEPLHSPARQACELL